MANFVSYINNLQAVELSSGAVKVLPPPEWTAQHNFGENSAMFDFLKVVPKAQSTTKLIDGIMKLNNNLLTDKGGPKSEIQLRVNKCSYLIYLFKAFRALLNGWLAERFTKQVAELQLARHSLTGFTKQALYDCQTGGC